MDLYAWITQQVDLTEAEGRAVLADPAPLLRRCEADRRILARHNVDPARADHPSDATACHGCGTEGDPADPVTDNLNDCPELLDLAHAHGITEQILAGLDRRQARETDGSFPADAGYTMRITHWPTPPITTSDVPEALRGPRWKP